MQEIFLRQLLWTRGEEKQILLSEFKRGYKSGAIYQKILWENGTQTLGLNTIGFFLKFCFC